MDFSQNHHALYTTTMSFLRARDPSILHGNLGNVRRHLNEDFSIETSDVTCTAEQEDRQLKVYLRIKGDVEFSDKYAIEEENLLFKIAEQSVTTGGNYKLEKYTFSKIFNPTSTQEELFNNTIKEKILHFINGRNSTIMAYGASGAGKTFTLFGTECEPGIIPRTLKYLYDSLPALSEYPKAAPLPNGKIEILNYNARLTAKAQFNRLFSTIKSSKETNLFSKMKDRLSKEPLATVDNVPPLLSLWVSMIEIHNEQIHDLLEYMTTPLRSNLKLGGFNDNIYIKGLKYIYVKTSLEAYSILQYGFQNQKRASTKINHDSSRSHCIFTIRLVQGYDVNNSLVSSFNFCDLAGSEKLKKTMHVGVRLKEANSINNSLLVLGRCINMLREHQKRNEIGLIPVRDSKLTQLLQKPLLGKEDIQMIVNINPSVSMLDETHSTLNFAAIAKEIKMPHDSPLKTLKPNRFSCYLQRDTYFMSKQTDSKYDEVKELRDQVAELTLELSEAQYEREAAIEKERTSLRETYENIISILNQHIAKLEREVHWLKTKKGANETIVLSDSDSEDNILEQPTYIIKNENAEIRKQNLQLKQQVAELEATLKDAKSSYKHLLEEMEKLVEDKFALEDKLNLQNEELEELRTFRRIQIGEPELKTKESEIFPDEFEEHANEDTFTVPEESQEISESVQDSKVY